MTANGHLKIHYGMVITVPETVLFQELGEHLGETVILDIHTGGYYGLNELGSRIWRLLQAGRSVGETIALLTQEYEVSEERLHEDIQNFLTELYNRSLIEVHDSDAP